MKLVCIFIFGGLVLNLDAKYYPLPEGHNDYSYDWIQAGQEELNKHLFTRLNYNRAKNVILFLGDGMGVNTVTAARIYKGQSQMGVSGEEQQLFMETLPFAGLSKTYSANKQVTGSAEAATSYLCGVKTRQGVVGVNAKQERRSCEGLGENSVTSILDWSHAEGKSVGVITTTRITHASPASAYAHTPDRDWESDKDIPEDKLHCVKDIAAQLIEDNPHIQVIMGGGRRELTPNTTADPEYPDKKGDRRDGKNLIQTWEENMQKSGRKYKYVWNREQFEQIDPEEHDYVLALFEPSHMQYDLDRNHAMEPSLPEMVEKAIHILKKNPKGFFLFVEGGRIDHGHHDVYLKKALQETVALDEAAMRASEILDERDSLIVVTADHSHAFTTTFYSARGNDILGFVNGSTEWPSDGLPATAIVYANGLTGIPANQTGRTNLTGHDTTADDYRFPSMIPTRWESHGGEDVPVYAWGPMSHLFTGTYEQNYIAHAMAYASCVGLNQGHCMGVTDGPPGHGYNHGTTHTTSLVLLLACVLCFFLCD